MKDVSSCSAGKLLENLPGAVGPLNLTTREIDQFSSAKCNLSLAVFEFIVKLKEKIDVFPDFCCCADYYVWIAR